MREMYVERSRAFAEGLGAFLPILMAPMAGACPPKLAAAIANAGGIGACGAVLMQPEAILEWAKAFRSESRGPFQINLWVTGPVPQRDHGLESQQREFLGQWGPAVPHRSRSITTTHLRRAMVCCSGGAPNDHLFDHGSVCRRTAERDEKERHPLVRNSHNR